MEETKKSSLTGIKHVTVPVADQDRALTFYKEKLGMELVVDVDFGEAQRWIELLIPGTETKVVLHTPQGQEGRIGTMSNIIFHTNDIDATYNELKEKGVEFTVPPTKESWGSYCIFKDSEGNSFCIGDA